MLYLILIILTKMMFYISMMLMKKNALLKIINNSLLTLPTPLNISIWWNMGSILGVCLILQILTGVLLSMRYLADTNLAFDSVIMLMLHESQGWFLRSMHTNGASLFFIFMYLHIGRGLYYQSHKYLETWTIGVLMFLMTMMIAFLGYVLPWGQMSYWGASVITNLVSSIPYLGTYLLSFIWGGYSVSNSTLTRFYSFHFMLPFVLMMMTLIHLLFLHVTGSNNPLGLKSLNVKINFYPYFLIKDMFGFCFMLLFLLFLVFFYPNYLGDCDNYIMASSLITPVHIQPEWYFLFAYAILRSIPNKLGGVIAMLSSILILMLMPITNYNKFQGLNFYPMSKLYFWLFINTIMLLTWIGMRPVENPYIIIGQMLTLFYFFFFIMNPMLIMLWDKLNK